MLRTLHVKNRNGFGMVELLVSLAVIVAVMYYVMAHKTRSLPDTALQNAQKRLQAQGVQTNLSAQSVGTEVQAISVDHEKNLDCATGEGTGCSINGPGAAPASAPSAPEPASLSSSAQQR